MHTAKNRNTDLEDGKRGGSAEGCDRDPTVVSFLCRTYNVQAYPDKEEGTGPPYHDPHQRKRSVFKMDMRHTAIPVIFTLPCSSLFNSDITG
jgi:hypothetical protein